MAQGYIIRSNGQTQSLEDIGHEYCKKLLSKSLFEVGKRDDDLGRIVRVKMHDLMHDLAIQVAGDEISNMKNLTEKTRHLSTDYFYEDLGKVSSLLQKASKLWTILLMFRLEQWNDLVSNLPSALRVLDLRFSNMKEVPHSIGKLKRLRYLDLSCNEYIEKLPTSITRLHNLQVLNLMRCQNLRQLPKAIHRLVNLRNLDISYCFRLTHMPRGIGKLSLLCELSEFIVANPKHSRKKRCGGLDELPSLNNLRGSLKIYNLHLVEKSASSEFWAPNLIEKQQLQSLGLNWGREIDGSNGNDNKEEEMFAVMEALRPHPRLKELEIRGYGGVKISSWLSSLTNLTSLVITWMDKMQHLPPLQHLFSLGSFSISYASELEYIEDSCNINNQERVSGSSTPIFFPSLKQLILNYCPSLKGWWPTTETEDLPQFPCLSDLDITDCPNLTSIPLLPALESLELRDGNLQLLHQIFKIPPRPHPQPLFSSPSSSLTHLPSQVDEEEIQNLQQKHLPEESSFRHLTSLKKLVIGGRSGLAILSRVMQNLISLEHLTIRNVKGKELSPSDNENEEENDDLQWQCLRSLKTLGFLFIRDWASLPKGLQQLTTLHSLNIEGCLDLVSLPDWVGELSSLQHLEIDRCPHLIKRCGNNKGEDWPLIAHIPNIQIEFKSIQRDGNYLLQSEEGSLARGCMFML